MLSSNFSCWQLFIFVFLRPCFFWSGWVCQWKPFWIAVGDTLQKAYLEEWIRVGDDSASKLGSSALKQFLRSMSQRWYVILNTKIVPSNINNLWKNLHHRDQRGSLMLLPGNFLDPRVLHSSGRERRHHCLTQNVSVILFTRSSSVPFQNVWNCRFPVKRSCRAMRKLSLSAWVKTDPNVTLERHTVDVQKGCRRISRGIRKKTRYIFSGVSLRQQRA